MSDQRDRQSIVNARRLMGVLLPLLGVDDTAKVQRLVLDLKIGQPARVTIIGFADERLLSLADDNALAQQLVTAGDEPITHEELIETLRRAATEESSL